MTENTSLNLHSEDFWVKAETQDPPQEAPLDESDEDKVLFEGDTGELPEIVRNVLVHLLRGPYFERSSSRRLWHALVTNEAVIRSRLSELYLDLFLDEEAGIAFCRRPNLGELDVPTLLPRVRLRFLDSTLIVELRERLMRAQETGERVHVTRQDLREILRLYDAAVKRNPGRVKNDGRRAFSEPVPHHAPAGLQLGDLLEHSRHSDFRIGFSLCRRIGVGEVDAP